ncbi:putative secreted lipprotein [Lasiodiplodia theobromae]|uniref:Putative secreted lipprotein n=1 Tax=Lasiodiplodia theobromae TaxID=45133 RepID=A0A5N5DAE3_9PEZI|nr:putative secreted lipprotein [Lasiodiplodia theobromae]
MQSTSDASAGFPHVRRCFYVHGKPAVNDGTVDPAATSCTLYVEHLTPYTSTPPTAGSKSKPPPIIFIPGAAHTSACWVTTPDGRPGWSSYFLARGHDVYLVDPPFTGRSPWAPHFSHSASSSDVLTTIPAQVIAGRWTALAQQAPWPQARLHTQWPGTGRPGDPAFEALAASLVALPHDVPEAATQRAMRAAGAALVDRIVGEARRRGRGDDHRADIGEEEEEEEVVVLVAHSLGAPRALLIADARPSHVSGLVLLEPNGPPWSEQALGGMLLKRPWGLTEAEITWSPPRGLSAIAGGHDEAGVVAVGDDRDDDDVRGGDHTVITPQEAHFNLKTEKSTDPARNDCTLQVEDESSGIAPRVLSNLVDVPVAVITGEASHHAMYDWCTVRFLRQAGVKRVDHIELWKKGIRGNGHLFISEKNSDEIAEVTRVWIDSLGAR